MKKKKKKTLINSRLFNCFACDDLIKAKEARPFVKPNEGFCEQLRKLESDYCGKKEKEEIEDPFTKKKRQEIEAEKAMLKGATSVKNKLEMFKKAEDEERIRTPTPNKLKMDWNCGQSDSNNNQPNGSAGEKVAPKKLTSILGLFQQRDENVPRPAGFANSVIQKNTGTAKKWKPVETKGLQRTKDPQVKSDPHRDYSVYEKVKKSKSGTKWASKKESLKRQKSKENQDTSKLLISDDNRKSNNLSNNSSRSQKINQPHNPPVNTSTSTLQSNKFPASELSSSTNQSQAEKKVATKSLTDGKRSDSVTKTCPPPPPPPMPSEDLYKSPATTTPIKKVTENRPKLVLTKQDSQSKSNVEAASKMGDNRPPLRRRPSQENKEVESPEAIYPWRRRRRSSNVDLNVQPRRRSSITSNDNDVTPIKSLTRENSEQVNSSNVFPSSKSASNQSRINDTSTTVSMNSNRSTLAEQPNTHRHVVEVKTTPPTPTPENKTVEKPKVFGLNRPKAKNIVGGSIWSADERSSGKSGQNMAANFNRSPSKSPSPMSEGKMVKNDANSNYKNEPKKGDTLSKVQENRSKIGNFGGGEQQQRVNALEMSNNSSTNYANNRFEEAKSKQNMTSKQKEKNIKSQSAIQSSSSSESDQEFPDDDIACQPTNKGLTRSSTAEILKLIKSKTKPELAQSMELIEEDEEIDVLLNGLEKEGIENIDWGELGIGLEEVKQIVDNPPSQSSSSEESSDDDDDDEDDEESLQEEDEEEQEIAALLKNLGDDDFKELNLSDRESPVTSRCKS